MYIENLRVVDNDTIETPEGTIEAPVSYFMDVAINDEETFAVPVSQGTFDSLRSLVNTMEAPLPREIHRAYTA